MHRKLRSISLVKYRSDVTVSIIFMLLWTCTVCQDHWYSPSPLFFFFLNVPPPTEISPLPLHDALPIGGGDLAGGGGVVAGAAAGAGGVDGATTADASAGTRGGGIGGAGAAATAARNVPPNAVRPRW